MKNWEYATVRTKVLSSKAVVEFPDGREEVHESILKALNALGASGWEVCGAAENQHTGQQLTIFLKR